MKGKNIARIIRPGIKICFLAVGFVQVPCTALLTRAPCRHPRIAAYTGQQNTQSPLLLHRMNQEDESSNIDSKLKPSKKESLATRGFFLAIYTIPFDALLVHFQGWSHFFSSLSEMRENASAEEFSSALNFWLFGAISHPLVHGAFGVSEIMHASPGLRIAGLVPVSFALACGFLGYALWAWDKVRLAATSLVLSSFLLYVGAGLDGSTESLLADYNIQLDDDYQGRVIKGCPSPESVQASSVHDFDYNKYQGRWYWHKVHDWTQFDEMYDTTLDIRLTENGYINTLDVKGPSPLTNSLSWDKSPLLNGVRYSWEGRIESDGSPPGVSQETGFGVSFPNYIIDVQTKSEAVGDGSNKNNNKQYQELIQFQCIEVGGVRLYEGVDFMSRSPIITDPQLEAMQQRAKALYPYGAAPEQMHRIDHQVDQYNGSGDIKTIHNAWQDLWKSLDIEKYLDQSLK